MSDAVAATFISPEICRMYNTAVPAKFWVSADEVTLLPLDGEDEDVCVECGDEEVVVL